MMQKESVKELISVIIQLNRVIDEMWNAPSSERTIERTIDEKHIRAISGMQKILSHVLENMKRTELEGEVHNPVIIEKVKNEVAKMSGSKNWHEFMVSCFVENGDSCHLDKQKLDYYVTKAMQLYAESKK